MVNHDKVRFKMKIVESNLFKLYSLSQFSSAEFLSDFRNVEAYLNHQYPVQLSIEGSESV